MSTPEVVTPVRAGFSASRLERIDSLVRHYVDSERLAGIVSLVYRRGDVVHCQAYGQRDREAGLPMELDTIFRIYSMTKPVTTVAALMLLEQGYFLLNDPIAKYLPAFADVQVYGGSRHNKFHLVLPERPPTIQDLMRHTAGFSYGWFQDSPVEAEYRRRFGEQRERTLAENVEILAQLPLLYQPGTAWRYSYATDLLGRLVEVVSGESLDDFFHNQIFAPLGMHDTGFHVPAEKRARFAALYSVLPEFQFDVDTSQIPPDEPLKLLDAPASSRYGVPPISLSGGSGLVSTAADYLRFCQMLLNGGVLDGVRLLGPKTVDLMTMNHLPPALVPISNSGTISHGFGFGLGVSVLVDVAASAMPGSAGSYQWSGLAGTRFWIDPAEELIGIFMVQFMPGGFYPVQQQFRVGVYQALVE